MEFVRERKREFRERKCGGVEVFGSKGMKNT